MSKTNITNIRDQVEKEATSRSAGVEDASRIGVVVRREIAPGETITVAPKQAILAPGFVELGEGASLLIAENAEVRIIS